MACDCTGSAHQPGSLPVSDLGFASAPSEMALAEQGIQLPRTSRTRERQRFGEPILKKARRLIESVDDDGGCRAGPLPCLAVVPVSGEVSLPPRPGGRGRR
ncbi:hypothetical protein GCM10025734_09430 [Kitasatospora paranensis]